jgi:hypothetical protein
MPRRKTSSRPDGAVGLAGEPRVGSHLLVFNDHEVLQLLRAAVESEGGQTAFSKRHGVDRAYLNMVLSGKRGVGDSIVKALGLRKVYTRSD